MGARRGRASVETATRGGPAAGVQPEVEPARTYFDGVEGVKMSGSEAETSEQPAKATEGSADQRFGVELARAVGGAIVFALPMLMTAEMWALGFYIERYRLALLLLLSAPLLMTLNYFVGFRETFDWQEDLADTGVAYAVGFAVSAILLLLFSVLEVGMTLGEVVGKVALQAVPASIGAALAVSQLGLREEAPEREASYLGELVTMVTGALFLALNIAPTEEVVRIVYQFTPWHALALVLTSLLIMHAFVYSVEFRGQEPVPQGAPLWSIFVRFTVVGYALALLISLYALWTFGRVDGVALDQTLMATVVLGFPAAVGAAAARLIL